MRGKEEGSNIFVLFARNSHLVGHARFSVGTALLSHRSRDLASRISPSVERIEDRNGP